MMFFLNTQYGHTKHMTGYSRATFFGKNASSMNDSQTGLNIGTKKGLGHVQEMA